MADERTPLEIANTDLSSFVRDRLTPGLEAYKSFKSLLEKKQRRQLLLAGEKDKVNKFLDEELDFDNIDLDTLNSQKDKLLTNLQSELKAKLRTHAESITEISEKDQFIESATRLVAMAFGTLSEEEQKMFDVKRLMESSSEELDAEYSSDSSYDKPEPTADELKKLKAYADAARKSLDKYKDTNVPVQIEAALQLNDEEAENALALLDIAYWDENNKKFDYDGEQKERNQVSNIISDLDTTHTELNVIYEEMRSQKRELHEINDQIESARMEVKGRKLAADVQAYFAEINSTDSLGNFSDENIEGKVKSIIADILKISDDDERKTALNKFNEKYKNSVFHKDYPLDNLDKDNLSQELVEAAKGIRQTREEALRQMDEKTTESKKSGSGMSGTKFVDWKNFIKQAGESLDRFYQDHGESFKFNKRSLYAMSLEDALDKVAEVREPFYNETAKSFLCGNEKKIRRLVEREVEASRDNSAEFLEKVKRPLESQRARIQESEDLLDNLECELIGKDLARKIKKYFTDLNETDSLKKLSERNIHGVISLYLNDILDIKYYDHLPAYKWFMQDYNTGAGIQASYPIKEVTKENIKEKLIDAAKKIRNKRVKALEEISELKAKLGEVQVELKTIQKSAGELLNHQNISTESEFTGTKNSLIDQCKELESKRNSLYRTSKSNDLESTFNQLKAEIEGTIRDINQHAKWDPNKVATPPPYKAAAGNATWRDKLKAVLYREPSDPAKPVTQRIKEKQKPEKGEKPKKEIELFKFLKGETGAGLFKDGKFIAGVNFDIKSANELTPPQLNQLQSEGVKVQSYGGYSIHLFSTDKTHQLIDVAELKSEDALQGQGEDASQHHIRLMLSMYDMINHILPYNDTITLEGNAHMVAFGVKYLEYLNDLQPNFHLKIQVRDEDGNASVKSFKDLKEMDEYKDAVDEVEAFEEQLKNTAWKKHPVQGQKFYEDACENRQISVGGSGPAVS